MLSKLIGYDMRALARVLGPIEAIALVVGALAGGCGALGYWVNEISALPSSISGLLEVLALSVLGIGAMGIACLIPATLVILLHRYYTNLFTDQGYLTFTLPVRASNILWAKVVPGIAWLAISCAVTLACALFVSYGVYGFMPDTPLTSTIPYWILSGPFLGWESGSAAAAADMLIGGACTLVSIASVLMMGYAGFTLGATWARQHKVVCGIALFLGIWLAVSLVSTMVFAVTGAIVSIGPSWSGFGPLMQGLGFLRDIAVCVISFAICLVCLKGHINLS